MRREPSRPLRMVGLGSPIEDLAANAGTVEHRRDRGDSHELAADVHVLLGSAPEIDPLDLVQVHDLDHLLEIQGRAHQVGLGRMLLDYAAERSDPLGDGLLA